MSYLRTSEAAARLNVTASTLRTWERRFGYPRPERSPGRHRQYSEAEILALRDALQDGLSISSAISRARRSLGTDAATLAGALGAFDAARADSTLEAALELRSVEGAVEDLLLPTLDALAKRHGADSAAHAFAVRWSVDWLRRARRVLATGVHQQAILVGDASEGENDVDGPAIGALELFAARAGMRVVTVPVHQHRGLSGAVAAIRPDLVVVAGRAAQLDTVARWVFGVRSVAATLPVALFRTGVDPVAIDRRRVGPLPPKPSDALQQLVELTIDEGSAARADAAPAHPTRRIELPAARRRAG